MWEDVSDKFSEHRVVAARSHHFGQSGRRHTKKENLAYLVRGEVWSWVLESSTA